jgi:hypothetical protein
MGISELKYRFPLLNLQPSISISNLLRWVFGITCTHEYTDICTGKQAVSKLIVTTFFFSHGSGSEHGNELLVSIDTTQRLIQVVHVRVDRMAESESTSTSTEGARLSGPFKFCMPVQENRHDTLMTTHMSANNSINIWYQRVGYSFLPSNPSPRKVHICESKFVVQYEYCGSLLLDNCTTVPFSHLFSFIMSCILNVHFEPKNTARYEVHPQPCQSDASWLVFK